MKESACAGKRNLLTNAVASWAGFVAQLIVAYFMVPILLHGLGDRRYGIWSLVESILAYLTLFDLGLAASIVRYVARFEACEDRAQLNRVFTVSLMIFGAAGLIALAIALGLAFVGLPLLDIPDELIGESRWLMVLLGINLTITLPLSVFPCVLDGLGRYPAKSTVRTAILLLRVPLFLAVLGGQGGLVALAVVICGCNLLEHVVMAVLAWRYIPHLRFAPAQADWATFRLVRGYSLDAFLAMLAGRISFRTDAIVIGAFLAPQFITFFAIAAQLVENAKSLLRSATTVVTPAVSELEARGDHEAIRNVLVTGTRYVLYLIVPIQIGFIVLGKPFIALWLKSPHHAEMTYATLVILSAPLALTISQSVSGRILYGLGRIRWFARAVLAEAMVNLLLSLVLVRSFGIEGVALGTTLPHVVFNIGLMVCICKMLRVGIAEYLQRSFLKPLLATPVLTGVWMAGSAVANPLDWTALLTIGCLGVLAYGTAVAGMEFGGGRLVRIAIRMVRQLPLSQAGKV